MNTVAPRFHGKLTKWNTDRGFGFVAADQGGQELFVHVSAFPRDGRALVIGERVMARLKALDEVAYVRFASVYRSFRDIDEFMSEMGKLVRSRPD